MIAEIKFVGEMQKLTLMPGDTLIVTGEADISTSVAEHIRLFVEGQFPGHKCIVLGGGLKLDVMEKA